MICLNSLIDWMFASRTTSLQALQSAPVVRSFDVVAMTGNGSAGEQKLSNCFLPSGLSPVIRMT